jgi:amino acid transporter
VNGWNIFMTTDENGSISSDDFVRELGFAGQQKKWMSPFQNFGISFSIICIVAGGITALPAAFSAGGGAAVGVMWPIGSFFALFVAASMAQLSSAFPTAGGPFHWASLLGGRGIGWVCGWINLLGLIFLLASVNVGFYNLSRDLLMAKVFNITLASEGSANWLTQTIVVGVITLLQAFLNHRFPQQTFKLIAYGVVLIIATALALSFGLLAYAGQIDLARLFRFTDFTGASGGNVWPKPFSTSPYYVMVLGLLHVVYTKTGYDASSHMAEETKDAVRAAPRGTFLSVVVSAVFGYIMVCAIVLAIPTEVMPEGQTVAVNGVAYAASQGWGMFNWLIDQSPMPQALKTSIIIGIVAANFVCGLAALTATSRTLAAFARDGAMPFSEKLAKFDVKTDTPAAAIWASATFAVIATLYSQIFLVLSSGSAVLLYISYLIPIVIGMVAEITGRWKPQGSFTLGSASVLISMLAMLGGCGLIFVGIQPPQEKVFYLLAVMLLLLATRWQAMQGAQLFSVMSAILTFIIIMNFVTEGFSILPDNAGLLTLSASIIMLAICAFAKNAEPYHGPITLNSMHKADV